MTILGPINDGKKDTAEMKSRLDLMTSRFLNEGRIAENINQVNEKFDESFSDNRTRVAYLQAEDTLLLKYKSDLDLFDFKTKQSFNQEGNKFILDAIGRNGETGPDCINYYFYVVYNNADSLSKNSQSLLHAFDAFFDNYRQRLNPTHQQHKAVLLMICKDKTGIMDQIEEVFYRYNRSSVFETHIFNLSEI